MPTLIEAHKLTKSFGPIQALRDLDLAIQSGETYGLLGPNGSGKTTLIRILAGLLLADQGEALVLGYRMPNREALTQVGYMTQATALYPDLTVRENISFFAALYGGVSRARLDEVIALVELEGREDSLLGTLSGGMKQRVSLACALVHRPRLLLLDEPTVGIDPQLRAGFWNHFHQLNREGITILLSTHVMDEAERCDRLGMLRDGQLLAEGKPEEIKAQVGSATLEEAFLRLTGGPDAPR
ncbi:MAG: ABC transporter ATP-binding protein [Chloroflexi bacterium]|nr:ABC transporter ATP-binding protein [Chloroflexota bacterium]